MNLPISHSLYPLSNLLKNIFPPLVVESISSIDELNNLNFIDVVLQSSMSGVELSIILAIPSDFELAFFGVNGLKVSLSDNGVVVSAFTSNTLVKLTILTEIKLTIPPMLLKSVPKEGAQLPADERVTLIFPIDFSLEWRLESDFQFDVQTLEGFTLDEALIGETGFIIAIENLRFNMFADVPPEDYEFSLDKASINPPDFLEIGGIPLPTLNVLNASMNKDGFSGIVSVDWPLVYDENNSDRPFFYQLDPPSTPSEEIDTSAKLFGIWGGINHISLSFQNNELVGSEIKGRLLIPYFEEPVEIRLNIISGKNKLDFTITLLSLKEGGIELKKDELIALYMKSLSISKKGDYGILAISGGMQPLLWASDGLEWPRLDIEELSLTQNLNDLKEPPVIKFKEAWVDLKKLATLDLFGFHFELNRIGVGYIEDTDQMWLDLTGSLKLIDQLPIGVGVEGFRLVWPRTIYEDLQIEDPKNLTIEKILEISGKIQVKFDGIHLAHGIPHTVEFDGYIRFIKEAQKVGFAGGVSLRVPSTGLALEANLLIGMNFQEPAYPFLYIHFGIMLPAGIPLAQSGLALKGAEGLVGFNVEPAIESGKNPYYDWYKPEPEGITSALKWRDKRMSFAFGAGVTITTVDGKTLGIQGLLVLVIPGPIIMLEGKALIFDGVFPSDGPLKALAYFDGNSGTVQVNIEAALELADGVIDVNAGIEAFFDFKNLGNWHLYLGKDEPEDRKIHANILKIPKLGWLFKANAYLMLDMFDTNDDGEKNALQSRLGMHIGFEPPKFEYKVASAEIKAVLDGEGQLTINPFQFNGGISLDATLDVSVFDVLNITIGASAQVSVEGVLPLVVDAEVACHVDLPVPDLESIPIVKDLLNWIEEEIVELPDIPTYIDFKVPFHWEVDKLPVLAPLISEITVESYFVQGGGRIPYFHKKGEVGLTADKEFSEMLSSLVVPLDAKPSIIFDQDMNQDNTLKFGGFLNNGNEYFFSGKIAFKPTIKNIKIYSIPKHKLRSQGSEQSWGEPIAEATADTIDKRLWGMFRPEPSKESPDNAARRVLQLWSNNPFDFVNSMISLDLGGGFSASTSYTNQVIEGDHLSLVSDKKTQEECIDQKILERLHTEKKQANIVRINDDYYPQMNIKGVLLQSSQLQIQKLLNTRGEYVIATDASKLYLRFPETVANVRITFSDSDKTVKEGNIYKDNDSWFEETKDEDSHALITKYKGREECNNTIGHFFADPQAIIFSSPSSLDISAPDINSLKAIFDEGGVLNIDYGSGFNCLDISSKSLLNISKICWVYKAERTKKLYREHLEEVNTTLLDEDRYPERLLSANSYYKLEVEQEIVLDEKHSDEAILAVFQSPLFAGELSEYRIKIENNIRVEEGRKCKENVVSYFQTDGPPRNIRPYIKWVSPKHQSSSFFYEDDIVIRFNRSYISKFYPSSDNSASTNGDFPHSLSAIIKGADGKIVTEYFHNWTDCGSASLLPQEQEWYKHANEQLGATYVNPTDNVLELRRPMLLKDIGDLGLGDWDTVELGKNNNDPEWHTNGDRVEITTQAHSDNSDNLSEGGSLYLTGEETWDNYHLRFTNMVPSQHFGIEGILAAVFLYESPENYYYLQIERKVDSTDNKSVLSLFKIQDGIKTPLSSKTSPRGRGPWGLPIDIYIRQTDYGTLSINVFLYSRSLIDLSDTDPATLSGKIGFYSANKLGVFGGVKVSSLSTMLKPKSRYELILTGGEGGETIFKDDLSNTQNNPSWKPVKGNVLYKEPVDDFELVSSLKLNLVQRFSFVLRYSDKTKTYYELVIYRHRNSYNFILQEKSTDFPRPTRILSDKKVEFNNTPISTSVRIRMVGNSIKVWFFDKQVFDMEIDSLNISYVGKIGVNYYQNIQVFNSFELRDVSLYKSTFTTSAFKSFSTLVSSYRGNLKVLSAEKIILKDLDNLFSTQLSMSKKKIDLYRDELLYDAKSIDRGTLELSKQKMIASMAEHDRAYLLFINKMGDMAYQPLPESVEISQVKNSDGDTLGLLIRSPKSLDPLFSFNKIYKGFKVFGRTSIGLDGITSSYISNADGTTIFIFTSNNELDRTASLSTIPKGSHLINFNNICNFDDDNSENSGWNHLFDRPYTLRNSNRETDISIQLNVTLE